MSAIKIEDSREPVLLFEIVNRGGAIRHNSTWLMLGMTITRGSGVKFHYATSRQIRLPGERVWRRIYITYDAARGGYGSRYISTKEGFIRVFEF